MAPLLASGLDGIFDFILRFSTSEDLCPPLWRDRCRKLYDSGVEAFSSLLTHELECLRNRQGTFVCIVTGFGVECVHHSEDASRYRNLLAAQALRESTPIVALVVPAHYI